MAKQTRLADLAPNPRNPRKITDDKLAQLKKSLDKFGDLSGVVFNVRSGQLVGGHQRVKVLPQGAQVVVSRAHDVATPAGTVREGHVLVDGERFAYREVDWDEATEKAANLATNKGAGEFDLSAVAEWMGDLDAAGFDLDLTMFAPQERSSMAVPVASDDSWDEALQDVPMGEQGDIKTVTFTLSQEQHRLVMQRVDEMKALGPFVDTGNENANGNALARLAEMHRG